MTIPPVAKPGVLHPRLGDGSRNSWRNYYVIQVDETTLAAVAGKEDIQHTLKGRRGVHQPERHTVELIRPGVARERVFRSIILGDWYLPVPGVAIKDRKDFGFSERVKTLVHPRDGVHVSHGQRVQSSVVDAETEAPI